MIYELGKEALDVFEPHMVHPLQCKAIASARLKNDKAGAATLAQLLRADLLPEAWIAPPEVRQLRALLRHRAQLARPRTLLRNRVHAVLADHGYGRAHPGGARQRPHGPHGHISKQGPAWARRVPCEAAQTAKRHPDFAPGYEALARRRGKKIATTAVARKLLTRAWHLLTDAGLAVPQPAPAPAPGTQHR